MNKIKSILFYGNCQTDGLGAMFRTFFTDTLKIRNLMRVDKIESEEYFTRSWPQSLITSTDALVMQYADLYKVNPLQHILPFLKPGASVVTIPSLYCSYFHPELFQSKKLSTRFPGYLHDFNILEAFANGKSKSSFLESDPFDKLNFYTDDYLNILNETNINEHNKRYTYIKSKLTDSAQTRPDINFSDFTITDMFKTKENIKTVLWGDVNHPLLPVFKYVFQRICENLNIKYNQVELDKMFINKQQNGFVRPVYKSVITHLGLNEMVENKKYFLGDEFPGISREQFVDIVYDVYNISDKNMLIHEYEVEKHRRKTNTDV